MSNLTSTRLSRGQYVLAIAGATGRLGKALSEVFLTTYRPFFSSVRVLVRDPSSEAARALAQKGAEVHHIDLSNLHDSLSAALRGVDVVVNALATSAAELSDAVFDAALESGVRVYFPPEFGVDHQLNDFPGFEHSDWAKKKAHESRVRERAGSKMKVISVYSGLFLEEALNFPALGFDHRKLTYTCIGPPTQRIAFTSKRDIGNTLAELALLSLSPPSATRVPDHVQIAGNVVSFEELRDIVRGVRQESGVDDEVTVRSEDLKMTREALQDEMRRQPPLKPATFVRINRIIMGEGKLDFSNDNHNELVNPNEELWKWRTVEGFVREMEGWIDS
ncbi:NAD(P)-binding protein [Obba rivulosa]|uniref:NAD(P)-binding protein n=1 Tax=Obba rivulosa TaxID=1052685 RepID=A0A8E2DPC2_9APHY|nr:NAD(P)-binding protein [Obba rivulosa]